MRGKQGNVGDDSSKTPILYKKGKRQTEWVCALLKLPLLTACYVCLLFLTYYTFTIHAYSYALVRRFYKQVSSSPVSNTCSDFVMPQIFVA